MVVFRLFAIDLDGTLLHDDGSISDRTIKYLNNIKENNIIVFITGRNCKDAYKITRLITNNYIEKYVIYDDGQSISKIEKDGSYNEICNFPFIDKNDVKNIAQWAQIKNYDYVVLSNDTYTFNNNCNFLKYLILKVFYRYRKRNIYRRFNNKILENNYIKKVKIIGFGKNDIDSVYNDVKDRFSNLYSVINEGEIEIKNSLSTKLSAIKKLLDILQIRETYCFYFGNGGNDEECLRYFYNSFAVSNSTNRAIMAAKNVIPSNNNDGVYQALRTIVEEYI